MAGYVDYPLYCLDCSHCNREEDVMVGDALSGGPEESYSCRKGMNMIYFYYNNNERCPEYYNQDEDEWYAY